MIVEWIQRDFFWGGGSLDIKTHLVKWAIVCSGRKAGGLGVRGLYNLNRALLSKWLWHFENERKSLWRNVISSKFGGMVFVQSKKALWDRSLERD